MNHLIIAGFPKCGTTTLHNMVASMSSTIREGRQKELRHWYPSIWEGRPSAGYEAYRSHWPKDAVSAHWLLDSSPDYVFGADAVLSGLSGRSGDLRIIIVLRSPIDRTWSAFRFAASLGLLPKSLTFFEYCSRSIAMGPRRQEARELFHPWGSRYVDFLDGWFGHDFPSPLLLYSEDLRRDANGVMKTIADYLSIPSPHVSHGCSGPGGAHNVTIRPRSPRLHGRLLRASSRLQPFWSRFPNVKSRLRNSYRAVMELRGPEEGPDGRSRDLLADFFRVPNGELRQLLIRNDCQLPRWL